MPLVAMGMGMGEAAATAAAADAAGVSGDGLLGILLCLITGAAVTVTATPSWMLVVESFPPNGAARRGGKGQQHDTRRAAGRREAGRAGTPTRTND